jgi:hypothetical protein
MCSNKNRPLCAILVRVRFQPDHPEQELLRLGFSKFQPRPVFFLNFQMTVRIELGADEHVDVKNGANQNLSAALANAQGFIRRIEYLKLFVMQTNV